MIKTCIRCPFVGDIIFFTKGQNHCKECHNIAERKSYQKHKDKRALQKKIYNKTYLKRPNTIKIRKAYKKTDKYREYARNYARTKLQNNLIEKLKVNLRNRIRSSVKKRNESSALLIGCPVELLIDWLEFNFDDKMTWDNYGKYWHMDHIIPCASFDLEKKDQRLKCFSWKNIAPLEARKNESKHDKIDKIIIEYYEKRLELFCDNFVKEYVDI